MYYILTKSTKKPIIGFLHRSDAKHWLEMNDPDQEIFQLHHHKHLQFGTVPTTTVDDASRKP